MGATESVNLHVDILKAKFEERAKKPMKKSELIALIIALDPYQEEQTNYLHTLQVPELVYMAHSIMHNGHKYVPPSAPPFP
jgi:hypothetical protein